MVADMKPWKAVLIGCIIGAIILTPLVGIEIAILSLIIVFGIGLLTTGGFK